MDYTKVICDFFEQRPSINICSFSRESDVSRSSLVKIIRGERLASGRYFRRMLTTMLKYGYMGATDQLRTKMVMDIVDEKIVAKSPYNRYR